MYVIIVTELFQRSNIIGFHINLMQSVGGYMMTKLETMLKYVSEHNDFYKNRIKEYEIKDPLDITQWPVLTRKELQENRYNMFSDGYKAKYFNQRLRRQSSSG